MLCLSDVQVRYERAILALDGLSLEVAEGHIVALLGNNGSGKSTTLKAISGLLRSERGRLTGGAITLDGRSIVHLDAADLVRRGVFHVMEGRRVFTGMSVMDNLLVGAHTRRRSELPEDVERVFAYFPRLRERRRVTAGYLSGGEQQMLAIGRALMARPRLILLDEPSLGLAPLLVRDVFRIIQQINRDTGTTFLLVEQNAHIALQIANFAYVVASGRIVLEGEPSVLRLNQSLQDVYLGSGVAA